MIVETSRLYIRSLCETDWQEMKNIFIDFNNSKYAVYDMPLPTEDEEIKALIKKSNMFFTVFLKESRDMIGYVCFHKDGDTYDLGYCFHSVYHSNGYAFESTKALIEYFVDDVVQPVLPQEQRLTTHRLAGYSKNWALFAPQPKQFHLIMFFLSKAATLCWA